MEMLFEAAINTLLRNVAEIVADEAIFMAVAATDAAGVVDDDED